MLIIPTPELDTRIRQLAPNVACPPVSRSPYVMVPRREWFETKWNQQWWEYCTGRSFTYLPGSGMCEQFASAARVELNFDCLATVRSFPEPRRDVHVAAREVFVLIGAGAYLNGVTDGCHATNLVALTDDDKTYDLWFWEPQNRQSNRASEALTEDVTLIYHA